VLGVLLVPSAFTALWMTIFGNTALYLDTGPADGELSRAVASDVSIALFRFFEFLPGTNIASGLAILLIAVFFVTSADSGSLVVDTLAAGGEEDTPAYQRLFWVVLEGASAAILLVAGGLAALQTATIVAALPFAVVILLLCAGLARGMAADVAGREVMERHHTVPRIGADTPRAWFQRLGVLLRPPGATQVERFVTEVAEPALGEVASEFERRGVEAELAAEDGRVSLTVPIEAARDFVYGVEHASRPGFGLMLRDVTGAHADHHRLHMALTFFSDGRRGYDIMGYTRDQVVADTLDQFDLYRTVVASPESSLYVAAPENGEG
jgi:choline/glycine/proline betaine transport protein